jgi:hypothetical protein
VKQPLYIGGCSVRILLGGVTGQEVTRFGQQFYCITNYDRMPAFFMTLVSPTDHWMFISSTGALTAGRRTPDLALFPYYTEDKIHDSAGITGSKTVLIVEQHGRRCLWEPFSDRYRGAYLIRRNLYKNRWSSMLVFEEQNEDLALTFSYAWMFCGAFGFLREASLRSTGDNPRRISALDGLLNIMPCGVGSQFQLDKSNLLDAYKRNELLPDTGLGLFRLSSIPIDRPEPAEALSTNVAWSLGFKESCKLLSSNQLNAFRDGLPVREETDVRAERGAYLVQTEFTLAAGQEKRWWIGADVDQGPAHVANLNRLLRKPASFLPRVRSEVTGATDDLIRMIASADGLQKSSQTLADARHSANVLFNIMRGGIFDDGYRIRPNDLLDFVRTANREVAERNAAFFTRLKRGVRYPQVVEWAADTKDPQLERLCREYLPLTFSRRHGDPSRPWNRFSIASLNPDGRRILKYEGNWRDLFQNWEALARSFPLYLPGLISRFLSASTADGYNPYRVTRDGIDWEVVNPADPWAHIGYWGDHQIIYLLKLLELLESHEPDTLQALLTRDLFAYANVPYRIRPYQALLEDPKETVDFERSVQQLVEKRLAAVGSDGKLLWDSHRHVLLVNLTEKLLVAVLAKLSNFIPGAGIWMNTQRPEWNDANNALVGYGVSMVTLCYLRRFLAFCIRIFAASPGESVLIATEVRDFLNRIEGVLRQHQPLLSEACGDRDRKRILDKLGQAGSRYREMIYGPGFCGRRERVDRKALASFCKMALAWLDHSMERNRRPDGLSHAYNLIDLRRPGTVQIRRLYEMLEGQVALLSSGQLSAEESIRVLAALRRSALYRQDQHSYILYPNRKLPCFNERNLIPPEDHRRSKLLKKLVAQGDQTVVEVDIDGHWHFARHLTNAGDLRSALDQLSGRPGLDELVQRDAPLVLQLFERLFDHQSFTGRSGTFFAYEGLGSVYWHMVSKLLLAVQETFFRALDLGANRVLLRQLAGAYYDIRAGLGDHKTPAVYGAFPSDPYSHTPAHAGARQPGLTGQVKEDILCRFGELGVFVRDSRITFRPELWRPAEFLANPVVFEFRDVSNALRRLRLPAASLACTFCQVPVLFRIGTEDKLAITRTGGRVERMAGLTLDRATSRAIFGRSGVIRQVQVTAAGRHLVLDD